MSLPRHRPPSPIEEGSTRDEDEIVNLDGPFSTPNERFTVKTVELDNNEEDEKIDQFKIKVDFQEPEKRLSIFSHFLNLNKSSLHHKRNSIDLTIDECLDGDVLPSMENYRQSFRNKVGKTRLSIDELLNECQVQTPTLEEKEGEAGKAGSEPMKLSMMEGVLMNCLLNIWGALLFLRVTWVIGQAGLVYGLIIITLCNCVTLLTSLSMSAICTNGQITGGGLYYMISRSLGPEFGGAIGLMLTLANSMCVAMETIGFCESFLDMLDHHVPGFSSIANAGRINDLRLLGVILLVFLFLLAIGGMNWVNRVQILLLVVLVAAQIDFIVGSFLKPSDEKKAHGFVGLSVENFEENMWPEYTHDPLTDEMHNFFTVFAVIFPTFAGIDAGANLSGDLKDPMNAIPKGTLVAIGITYVSFAAVGILSAGTSVRYASGNLEEFQFFQSLSDDYNGTSDLNATIAFNNCSKRPCSYGLIQSQQMIEVISAWGPLIYAGCFAATLSTAISCLVGAPRIFQAVAKDKLYPYLSAFSVGWGPNNEPMRGYCLVMLIALVCVLVGDLNQVSSVLSNFFVASFAMINFSVFHASITKAPNWRPTFRYYSPWLSLCATLLCLIVMLLMDYRTAIATYLVIILLYVIIFYRKPDANWGSSAQSLSFISALKGVQTLAKVEDHVKTYRPKILLLSGDPKDRPFLVHIGNLITKRLSLLQCVNIIDKDQTWESRNVHLLHTQKWMSEHRIKAFYNVTKSENFKEGARAALELSGLGNLSPNLVMLGFKEKWKRGPQEAKDYVNLLQLSLEMRMSLAILRVQGGMTASCDPFANNMIQESKYYTVTSIDNFNFSIEGPSSNHDGRSSNNNSAKPKLLEKVLRTQSALSREMLSPINDETVHDETILQNMAQYKAKRIREGTIDVYWLYDTGGLTLLLPFIIGSRAMFAKCKLRVFVLANKSMNLKEQAHNMAIMLKKFRISFQQIVLISDATRRPEKHTSDKFFNMLRVAPAASHSTDDVGPGNTQDDNKNTFVSSIDLNKHRDKTNFYLRISEIVQENSSQAAMIFMTLPLPSKGTVPPSLYMAWLDFVSQNLPPFVYVRGNQASVLTFYS